MAHVLVEAGQGSRPSSSAASRRTTRATTGWGKGPHFVVEGDEYDTAYFDKGPKFLHYRPRTAILTSVEFDHADIYRDLAHYESAFEKFVRPDPAGRAARRCAPRTRTRCGSREQCTRRRW